jgi:RNA polymerase sigma factor (sigma-70 family)
MPTKSDEFLPTRASLITRLKNWDDQASWTRFFDTYGKLIYSVARKAGLADADAQDVVQETILAVAKQMPGFKYDPAVGSFKGWLNRVTRCRIIDLLRKRKPASNSPPLPEGGTAATELAANEPATGPNALDALWEEEWTAQVLAVATAKVKQQVDPMQYQLFHYHVLRSLHATDVARRLQVKPAEVYFAKYKVGRLIRNEIKRLERQMF